MNQLYVYTEGLTVVQAPGPLPRNWRNVSGLNKLDDASLAELGWLPATVVDNGGEVFEGYSYSFQGNTVVATKVYRARTPGELAEDLAAAKEFLVGQAVAARDAAIFEGVITLASGKLIDTSPWTQTMVKELRDRKVRGRPTPAGNFWRTADNQMVNLTSADLDDYSDQLMDRVNLAYQDYFLLKDQILAAVTEAELPVIGGA